MISEHLNIEAGWDKLISGLISQNYVQTRASAATFYPGAPLTVVGSLALRF